MNPIISVIIPTYNRCDLLEDAVRSVLAQTFQNFELIIVDDGSTDSTKEMLAPYLSDSRVKYVYQAHANGSRARNTGIKCASGQYLAFLDSDDIWSPEKLDRQLSAMHANPGVGVVYCACGIQQLNSEHRALSKVVCRPTSRHHDSLYEDLLYVCVIIGGGSSVLVSAACFSEVGLFDETLVASDWDMWTRLALSHKFFYLDEELVQVRKHGTNLSNATELRVSNCRKRLDILKIQVPSKFRFHLLAVEGGYYAACSLHCLRHRLYFSALEMTLRLLLLSFLHPVSTARGVYAMRQLRQPRTVGRKLRQWRTLR